MLNLETNQALKQIHPDHWQLHNQWFNIKSDEQDPQWPYRLEVQNQSLTSEDSPLIDQLDFSFDLNQIQAGQDTSDNLIGQSVSVKENIFKGYKQLIEQNASDIHWFYCLDQQQIKQAHQWPYYMFLTNKIQKKMFYSEIKLINLYHHSQQFHWNIHYRFPHHSSDQLSIEKQSSQLIIPSFPEHKKTEQLPIYQDVEIVQLTRENHYIQFILPFPLKEALIQNGYFYLSFEHTQTIASFDGMNFYILLHYHNPY